MNYDVQPETESVMKMIMDNPFVVSFHLFNINTTHSQIDCRVLVLFKFKYILFIINFSLTNPFYYQFLPNQSFLLLISS